MDSSHQRRLICEATSSSNGNSHGKLEQNKYLPEIRAKEIPECRRGVIVDSRGLVTLVLAFVSTSKKRNGIPGHECSTRTEMASTESVVIVEACRPGPVSGTYEYPTIGEFRAN